MRRLALALLCLVGCSGAPLRVYTRGRITEGQAQIIRDGADLLGRDVEFTSRKYGAVEVKYYDDLGRADNGNLIVGSASRHQLGCLRFIRLLRTANATTFAHEVGHAFRLKHSSDPDDIMYKTIDGSETALGEFESLDHAIEHYLKSCP